MVDKNSEIRKKFGLLINYLVEAGFTFEYIEHKIIRDPFFLVFENNDIDNFLSTPIEKIVFEVFKKEIYIDYSKPLNSELIWAGQMYITLLLNYRIPIQRSFIVYPLKKMISLFNPFHEMNDMHLCDKYLSEENSVSIFKELVKDDISLRKLAYLTDISERTLMSYYDNKKMYSMSHSNASSLAGFFGVPEVLFQKESNYCPDITALLTIDIFRMMIGEIVLPYLNIKDKEAIISYNNDHEVNTSKGETAIIECPSFVVKVPKARSYKIIVLNEKEKEYLIKNCIYRYLMDAAEGTLLF